MNSELKGKNGRKIKIGVYYIATGKYCSLFPEFLESLQNFFPECEKRVKVISDGLLEYKDYSKGNVIVDLCPRINNYPWPIITLYKMYHIESNFDFSCDYSVYFNGNSIIKPHDLDIFDTNKITVSYHSFNDKTNSYNPWQYINLNKASIAYLENGTYEYIQGGFFFGRSDLIYYMCKDVTAMVTNDTCRSLIAQWHDESYLNKWCVEHPDIVDKKYIMTAFEDAVDNRRFVFLRNKSSYNITR